MDKKLLKKLHLDKARNPLISELPEDLESVFEGFEHLEDPRDSTAMIDAALCFTEQISDLHVIFPKVELALKPDAVIWFAYPKKDSGLQSDLTREEGWEIVTEAGYKQVDEQAVDSIWSALRFRHQNFVGN